MSLQTRLETFIASIGADIKALRTSSSLTGMNGIVYVQDPRVGTGAQVWPAANRGIYMRVVKGGTISKIGMEVVTASGNISVAVYANSGTGQAAVPAARLATSGAVACPAAGYREVSLGGSVVVPDGGWLFMSCDNVTANFIRQAASGISASGILAGLSLLQNTSAHPAPATAAPLTTGNLYFPTLIGIP